MVRSASGPQGQGEVDHPLSQSLTALPLAGLWHPAVTSCNKLHSYLAGHCPNNPSPNPPLAAVVVVAPKGEPRAAPDLTASALCDVLPLPSGEVDLRSKDGEGEPFFRLYFIDRMSLAEVCALLTVIIGLLTLMVTVAKAAFDAGWKISNKEHDKNKKD